MKKVTPTCSLANKSVTSPHAPDIKICGITTDDALDACIASNVTYVGFVFFDKSPRNIAVPKAQNLAHKAKNSDIQTVGLFVDPTDDELNIVLSDTPLDWIQLHGHETPDRIAEIRMLHDIRIIKALPVKTNEDIDASHIYMSCVDMVLFDAKPPRDSENPGGLGKRFDWSLLKNRSFNKPWMLAGGLNAGNIGDALTILRPDALDISSGVETQSGTKSSDMIREFIQKVSNMHS